MATTPEILDVSPAPSAKGIVLSERITVEFDQEMDRSTINEGTFIVHGPDRSTVFSPVDLTPFDVAGFEEEDINSSPYVQGYIKGTISFEKIDASGTVLDESTEDTTGAGDLWFTRAIFTPNSPLEPDREYSVTIAGDETPDDAFDSGVRTRTVFDTVKASGSGTAALIFYGGYTGLTLRTYVVRLTSAGAIGDAEYEWWDANDPLTVYAGVTSTGERELEDGLFVTCELDGAFEIGDTFQVVVVPSIVLEDNYKWSFSTGNGSIQTPPSTSSASGIDSITDSSGGTQTTFTVSSITPKEREYGIEIGIDPYIGESILLTFSDDIYAASVNGNLKVSSEPANGDSSIPATGELDYEATISGDTISIVLDPGQLYQNNIIIITVDENVQSTSLVSLGSDYISYFSTIYNPLYTSIRRIQLDLGNIIADVPEETIMLAILEASLYADAISFTYPGTNTDYFHFARREFTTCMAELMLVRGLLGDSSLSERMTKSLGDLKVSRGGGSVGLDDRREKLEDCIAYWQVPLTTGGNVTPGASLLPVVAVKGSTAEDAIAVSRQWEPTSGIGTNSISAANSTAYASGRRRVRTFRKR